MMKKTFDPKGIENQWYQQWEEAGYFEPSGKGSPYCIILPPPNVTGSLHMGHGFQQTLMDALTRYHRMLGDNTHWQAGTDHAGIATQMIVERKLKANEISRHEIGREKFLEHVWQWTEESGGTIKKQLRRLGVSMDWSRERFTLDVDICEAVIKAFTQLYDEGLIYRGKRLVNWDPVLLTAISDLEVISNEEQGHLWHIRYPLENGDTLTVATTRPETMLGDTAVAVHPDDSRYQSLIGMQIKLPLTDRVIPIIADDYVDMAFGSGCVKITPAHDFNDHLIGKRHNLPIINVLTPDAHLNENTPSAYQGLDRFDARKKIVEDLQALDLIEKIEPHKLNVPRGDRSNAVIEPYLTDQWYVKTEPLAKPAIDAVKKGKLTFVPETWSKTYYQWLENIEDWCISRQLWWGHRIPAWYDADKNIYVGESEAHVREKFQLDNRPLTQDEDVLDTWFSSALWPFATLGWPKETSELKTFYPNNVLVTGFDIIFFWVARMIMFGLKFMGEIPFPEVYITGLIRDSEGQKMSKSKGNVLDPIDLIDGIDLESLVKKRTTHLMQSHMADKIEKRTRKEFPDGIPAFGTDALRFTFCALASTGRDINFDLGRTDGYRNFCNKLWNASRYVLMNMEEQESPINNGKTEYSLADRWIRTKLQDTIEKVHAAFEKYRFDLLAQALYEFTWNEYCDWYLELSKAILNDPNSTEAQLRATRKTLIEVLETLLRLIHPIMPFITEEIWQKVAPLSGIEGKTIMLQSYPQVNNDQRNMHAFNEIEELKNIIIAIRTIRSEANIPPGKKIPLIFNKGNPEDHQRIKNLEAFIKLLARIEDISWLSGDEHPKCATILIDNLECHIPLEGLIDISAESTRLEKEIEKLNKELTRSHNKLQNPNYVNNAPADIVTKEREKIKTYQSKIKKMKLQLAQLA